MNTPTEKQQLVINEAIEILRWCLDGIKTKPARAWDKPGISMRVEERACWFVVWPDGEQAASEPSLTRALEMAGMINSRKREKITKLREEADTLESQLSTDADDGPRMDAAGDAMPQMQEVAR